MEEYLPSFPFVRWQNWSLAWVCLLVLIIQHHLQLLLREFRQENSLLFKIRSSILHIYLFNCIFTYSYVRFRPYSLLLFSRHCILCISTQLMIPKDETLFGPSNNENIHISKPSSLEDPLPYEQRVSDSENHCWPSRSMLQSCIESSSIYLEGILIKV